MVEHAANKQVHKPLHGGKSLKRQEDSLRQVVSSDKECEIASPASLDLNLLPAKHILRLQREIGNQAVLRLARHLQMDLPSDAMGNRQVAKAPYEENYNPAIQQTRVSPYTPTVSSPAKRSEVQPGIKKRETQPPPEAGEIRAAVPRIQRTGWLESLGEELSKNWGGLWDSAGDVAGSLWDSITGSGKKAAEEKKPTLLPKPDFSVEYEVTDSMALIRTPPPDLDAESYVGMVIPKATKVKIIGDYIKSGKRYVEVEVISPPFVLPSGWTRYSNLSLTKSAPAPDKPAEDDDKSLSEELEEISKIIPPEYVEQTSDAEKREKVIGLANFSEDERADIEKGGKDALFAELEALQGTFVEVQTIRADDTLTEKQKREKIQTLQGEHIKKIKQLRGGLKNKKLQKNTMSKTDLVFELAKVGLTPEQWFADLCPSATFLGVPITGSQAQFQRQKLGGVHRELYERLKVAEQILMDETGLDETALGKEFGIKHIGGLRNVEPATGNDEGVGLHSLGLAIDIGTKSGPNPLLKPKFQTARIAERAAIFVNLGTSAQFKVGGAASKGKGKTSLEKRVTQADRWWDTMHDASEALQIYLKFADQTEVVADGTTFKLEELASAFGRETGEVKSASEWQEQIKQERDAITGGELSNVATKGFLNLDKRLVMALVKAGLSWGGTLDKMKDIHHFALHDGTIKKKPVSSTAQ